MMERELFGIMHQKDSVLSIILFQLQVLAISHLVQKILLSMVLIFLGKMALNIILDYSGLKVCSGQRWFMEMVNSHILSVLIRIKNSLSGQIVPILMD